MICFILSHFIDFCEFIYSLCSLTKVKRSSKTYEKLFDETDQKWHNQKFSKNINSIPADYTFDNTKPNSMCKLKYQQATIDVCIIYFLIQIF